MTLFDRQYRFAAGPRGGTGFEVGRTSQRQPTALRISFSVEKAETETPNTARVSLWNLNPRQLATLNGRDCGVTLRAGYGNHMSLIFAGTITYVKTMMDGGDRETVMEIADGRVPLTPQGPHIKRLDTIMEELHDDLSEGWDVNTRLNPNSYLNVQMTAIGDKLAELWELGEHVYQSKYPWSAEGASLDNAVQYGGISREGPQATIYPVHAECIDGTVIPTGTRIRTDTNPAVELSLFLPHLCRQGDVLYSHAADIPPRGAGGQCRVEQILREVDFWVRLYCA